MGEFSGYYTISINVTFLFEYLGRGGSYLAPQQSLSNLFA